MGKISKALAIFLTLIIAMSCLSAIMVKPANAQPAVHTVSQTIELYPQGDVVFQWIADFDLLVGDHIEGSGSVSNLGPYQLGPIALAFGRSGTSYEEVNVEVKDPNGHALNGINFTLNPSENSFNFKFTAQEQGLYQMWALIEARDYLQDAKNPVMALNYEWTGTPMKVSILSPLSQVYTKSNVSLNCATNKPMNWAGYSLDEAKNVTFWHVGYPDANSTTLTGLPSGVHSLTVYVNDSWGNMDSTTVTFTIEKPNTGTFGDTIVIAVVAVMVVIACMILALSLNRWRRRQVKKV